VSAARPASGLVVGFGARPGVAEAAVRAVLAALLDRHGPDPAPVRGWATLAARTSEPGLHAVAGPALRGYPADQLAAVPVPHPSARVAAAVGTPSVAEAAALRHAAELAPPGSPVVLAVPKLRGDGVTAALARFGPRRAPGGGTVHPEG
jgi:cobalamin biosynthesis protein CbiG